MESSQGSAERQQAADLGGENKESVQTGLFLGHLSL
jgi:hypothetical protein